MTEQDLDIQAEMLAVQRAHGEAEFARDLDRLMATMTHDACLEFVPLGRRWEGASAVRGLYARILPVIIPAVVEAQERIVAFAADALVTEHDVVLRLPGGDMHRAPVLSIFIFRDRKIAGQRTYVDRVWAGLWERALR